MGIESVTTQMAGVIPLTAVSGVAVHMTKAMFSNPMSTRRRRRGTRRRSTRRYSRRRNSFGGVSPI